MALAPVAEELGRNIMYLASAAIFAGPSSLGSPAEASILADDFFALPVFIIPCALARNLETMLVARFIMGIAGSTGSTMVGGTMGTTGFDLRVRRVEDAERKVAASVFHSRHLALR
jgi:MFS family permease